MSKVAMWGRWIVALMAAALAGESVWAIADNTFSMERGARFGPRVPWADLEFAILGVISALCAWGIIKWRPWAHAVAFGIFGFELLSGGLAVLVGDSDDLLYPIAAFLILAWLLIPSVRAAYWRRLQSDAR